MTRKSIFVFAVVLAMSFALPATEWSWLGPDGGDARSLAYDPANPNRIYLGTMAGKLFTSADGGAHWTRLARLGNNDYVLDSIAVDPNDSQRIYVAAWNVNNDSAGDMFRSTDGGKTWQALPGVHGKSLRAMALAPSDSKEVVAVALDGVYRSRDGGDTWALISPPHHAEIRNLQSVAIDPKNPDVIYVGTWHLPWKTANGGKTWESIHNGVITDSDVFSIAIDKNNPQTVMASACSGIYKSENAGTLFHKVQGMPFSARRTRVIQIDPADSNIVYAGTTEGLWKSTDAGHSFQMVTPPNVVVNSIVIDPRRPAQVLLATDRGGVLMSDDAAQTFSASNRGFSQRQVAALLVDRNNPSVVYAGLINDKEYGGVFVSHDEGATWQQMSAGLDGRDVFTLTQTASGTIIAGTNRGVFSWTSGSFRWEPINTILNEREVPLRTAKRVRSRKPAVRKIISRSEMETRVNDLTLEGPVWYAATPAGLFASRNEGKSWQGGAIAGLRDFIAVTAQGPLIAAATPAALAVSVDSGAHWYSADLPSYIDQIYGVAVAQQGTLWIATRQGAFRSDTNGDTWEHVLNGLPALHVDSIIYDAQHKRLFATSTVSAALYESADEGHHWQVDGSSGWQVRGVAFAPGHLYVSTAYDGVLSNLENSTTAAVSSTLGGGNQ